jgi:hypothetical protein
MRKGPVSFGHLSAGTGLQPVPKVSHFMPDSVKPVSEFSKQIKDKLNFKT